MVVVVADVQLSIAGKKYLVDGWLRVWSMELYKFADYEAYV